MKKLFATLLFIILLIYTVVSSNNIFIDKTNNRYYMLENELEHKSETYDVQIYGSCHAYTSFNPMYLIEKYNISSYNLSNPSEIIPITYLRMLERFKYDTPKVAVVEIWGTNPYETYVSTEDILNSATPINIELLPISLEKLSVIEDLETLDAIEENFAIIKYKDRVSEQSLNDLDFNYHFYKANAIYNPERTYWLYEEMINRFEHNGYKSTPVTSLSDYPKQQAKVFDIDTLEIEANIIKYIDKIITLCDKYNVELIFYRAPYRATENELRKANYLANYLEEKNIAFYDLEKEIHFDYEKDFHDYEHLSIYGSEKATYFLTEKIIQLLNFKNE